MNRTCLPVWLLFVWLLSCTAAQAAEQRVLLSFDGSGHRVRQIVYTENAQALAEASEAAESSVPEARQIAESQMVLRTGSATLLWRDDQGRQHAATTEPDPRLSHAPSHIDGGSESRLGGQMGAWLVTGPAKATQLIVLLPEDQSVGLAREMWQISLADH